MTSKMERWYVAVEIFDPRNPKWESYHKASGLSQLKRVVSLDTLLCPFIFHKTTPEDWNHNVHADFRTEFFKDPDYLTKKIGHRKNCQILGVVLEPQEEVAHTFDDGQFTFVGYDLVEKKTGISSLVNCTGGFPLAYQNSELNSNGLINSFSRAKEVQKNLKKHYAEDAHAYTELWALWVKE
jgi:hypothetical protein